MDESAKLKGAHHQVKFERSYLQAEKKRKSQFGRSFLQSLGKKITLKALTYTVSEKKGKSQFERSYLHSL